MKHLVLILVLMLAAWAVAPKHGSAAERRGGDSLQLFAQSAATGLRVVVSDSQRTGLLGSQLLFGPTGTFFYEGIYVDGILVAKHDATTRPDVFIPLALDVTRSES